MRSPITIRSVVAVPALIAAVVGFFAVLLETQAFAGIRDSNHKTVLGPRQDLQEPVVPLPRPIDPPITIAVIDSGVDLGNPNLAGQVLDDSYDFVDADSTPNDLIGHGTEMSGVIAAHTVAQGVCPSCKILALKVTKDDSFADPALVAQAVNYAVSKRAQIIYIGVGSLGAHPDLQTAVTSAQTAGKLIVAPAGSQELTQTFFPAAFPGVVSVVAVDDAGSFLHMTNSGGRETVAAPGKSISTTGIGGVLLTGSGSSIAAAYVAGVAGLLLVNQPGLSAAQLRHIIRHATLPLSYGEWSEDFYFGVLSLNKALAHASPTFQDLKVTRLTLIPHKPLTGQQNTARVRVMNGGNVPVSSASVAVTWGAMTLAPIPIPGTLNPGDEIDVEATLPVAVAAGDVPLAVTVTPTSGDGDQPNNSKTSVVPYTGAPEEDVEIVTGPLSEPVEEVGSVSVPVILRNRGNQNEPSVTLTSYMNGTSFATQTFALPVGAETSTTVNWTIPAPPRLSAYVLRIAASIPGTDVNPDNDRSFLTFSIGSRADPARLQYSDNGLVNQFVMDAPWRTILPYVPILIFAPSMAPDPVGARIDAVSMWSYDVSTGQTGGAPFAADNRIGVDTLPGITVLYPNGLVGGGITGSDTFKSFWHRVYRVPTTLLPPPGPDGDSYVRVVVYWSKACMRTTMAFSNSRVLRVFLGQPLFPKFAAMDRYYDAHVHTIAEQTTRDMYRIDAARKNFGGPLVMLAEASLATGIVDPVLVNSGNWNGNWTLFKDRIITTDHNIFYSGDTHGDSYDDPSAPGGGDPAYGPTSTTSGESGVNGEYDWYRTNFGKLAGEEVALRAGTNQPTLDLKKGHHFLVYDSDHVEGPWHGGDFKPFWFLLSQGVPNPNDLNAVLTRMKDSLAPRSWSGFGYAAHPYLAPQVWPDEYFCEGVGLPRGRCGFDSNCLGGPELNSAETDFSFKGLQMWNSKYEQKALFDSWLDGSEIMENMNPFPGGPIGQRFTDKLDWVNLLETGFANYRTELKPILVYNLKDCSDPGSLIEKMKFIRKLYMSAGTDAHGDFNYLDDTLSAASSGAGFLFGYGANLWSNAYARARTYTLAHDRPATVPGQDPNVDPTEVRSQNAYRDGNTVLTDGPICKFYVDSDGRHRPPVDPDGTTHLPPRWHDANPPIYENAEGKIGGLGTFDGGRTVLIPGPDNVDIMWARIRKKATPASTDISKYVLAQTTRTIFVDVNVTPFEAENVLYPTFYPDPGTLLSDVVATVLRGEAPFPDDLTKDERCITNPIWSVPVPIIITINKPPPAPDFPTMCPYAAGEVTVSFRFPISMTSTAGVFARKLDGAGNSTNDEYGFAPTPGWEEFNGVWNGKYTATNSTMIPCPPGPWDARVHAVTDPWFGSYVIYMTQPRELHSNLLNDIGRTFVTYCPGGHCPP